MCGLMPYTIRNAVDVLTGSLDKVDCNAPTVDGTCTNVASRYSLAATVRLEYRSVIPFICAANVFLSHFGFSHLNRRPVTIMVSLWP